VYHFSEAINNPEEYAKLTDCILREIEFSKDPRLEASRAVIRNLRKRHLYKCADEVVLSLADARTLGKVRRLHYYYVVPFSSV